MVYVDNTGRCSFFMKQRENYIEKQDKAIYAYVPFFQDALILGDSLAESILDFRLLRKNNVIAKRGRCVDMIQGDVLVAISLVPDVIFMEYGKNDILHYKENVEKFIDVYTRQIHRLQEQLPQTTIYINSIIPMRSDIMKQIGIDTHRMYNEKLMQMCDKLKLTFIDNSTLMDWNDDVYEYDGIHPKYPYYPKWLQHMEECAKLK